MKKTEQEYRTYVNILREELIPAGGCTEPIAIAYAAAASKQTLGHMPGKIEVLASGNLIKNAKSVLIPNGGDLRGVDAAAVLGALAGDAGRVLEVLEDVPEGASCEAKELLQSGICTVKVLESPEPLHLIIRMYSGDDAVETELKGSHTDIIRMEKNGQVVFRKEEGCIDRVPEHDAYASLSIEKIIDFADTCDLEDVREMIAKQIQCNLRIAEEGLTNAWGMNVGKLYYRKGKLLQAYAAAASDARMSGCNLPVVIVSGSGNQGATASLPVIIYAKGIGAGEEQLFRALVLSDLIAIHLKTGIGKLSAYCGAVCAATGSGCAMTYLDGGTSRQIEETLINSIGTASGIVCDGAKPSCAAKIAASLESSIMAHELAMKDKVFRSGEGIIGTSVEDTITAVGRMATEGMNQTDRVILDLMTGSNSNHQK